jgi:hypothetical protein
VLKIDVATQECSLIGGPFPGTNKWYGGLLGGDGNIYGKNMHFKSTVRTAYRAFSLFFLRSFVRDSQPCFSWNPLSSSLAVSLE